MVELATSTIKVPRIATSRVARYSYIVAGSVLAGVGIIGIFLPLLPTTIFFLLAAACYSRSSPGAYRWLTTNRYFGSYLRNYQEHRGATVGTKIISLVVLWLGIGTADYLLALPVWVEILLLGIAVGVSIHLLRLRTIRE
jgi:hypothetical protein